jgi:PAS domain S-box-containing protein
MMKNSLFILILLLSLSFPVVSGTVFAADSLKIDATTKRATLAGSLAYYQDSTRSLGLADVQSPPVAKRFLSAGKESPNLGFTDKACWFRFSIAGAFDEPRDMFLVIDNPLMDDVRFFYPFDGVYHTLRLGDAIPFTRWIIKNRNLVFPVTVMPGKSDYFVRIYTENSINFQATLWEPDYFYERDNAEQILLWMYYGLMFGFFLFNLFVMVAIRDLSYFYYTLFIGFYVLFRITYNGLGFQYFWPENIWWNSNSLPVIIALSIICFILFTRDFLRTRQISRYLDNALIVFGGGILLSVALQAVCGYRVSMVYLLSLSVITAFALVATGIIAMAGKKRESFFYMLAWSFFLVGSVLNILKDLSILPVNFLTVWSQQVGSAMTALLLTFGLADRINTMKKIVTDAHDELIRTYANLDEERELLSVTMRSIADAVITTNLSGEIVLINKSAETITGWSMSEAIGRKCGEVFSICAGGTGMTCDLYIERVKSIGEKLDAEYDIMLVPLGGGKKSIAFSMAPIRDADNRLIGTVIVFRDITERLKTEKEMQQSGKLKALGTFAGGLAHDFNNILTVIVGNLSLIRHTAAGEPDFAGIIGDTEKVAFRARDLTQQLLTFSRGGEPVKKLTDVGKLLREAASFVSSGSKTRIDFNIREDLWTAEVDAGQISQVFDNLVINAVQAMPGGGAIEISADNRESSDGNQSHARGKWIRVEIRDRGPGIPGDLVSRVFDPFFTTKPDGTGLGLSIAHSIIKKHGGTIAVESEMGEGTVFTIILPACPGSVGKSADNREAVVGGLGRILIMDDEDLLLKTACRMAESLGYLADPALNGEEALEKYRAAVEAKTPYDIIILDLTVPGGMGGRETIGRLREVDRFVRVIVSSGYSNDPVMANYRFYGFNDVIIKPYGIEELSRALGSVTGGKSS